MFYKITVRDYARVPPKFLDEDIKVAVLKTLKETLTGHISKDLGIVIDVLEVKEVGEGKIIPEDEGIYFPTVFDILTYKPEQNELVLGQVSNITEFGAFLNIGVIEGLVHISQVMDDYVSYSKDGVLSGRDTKKVLKVGDKVRARIIAISFKDLTNPKISLTMRQPGLGKIEWLREKKAKKKKKKK